MRDWNEGGVYLEHLQLEHRHLREEIEAIGLLLSEIVDDCGATQWRQLIGERFASLRQNLVKHFDEEENEGCFEEVLCRLPSFTRCVHSLEKQHQQLLMQLDQLVIQLSTSSRAEVLGKFQDLSQRLLKHEQAENAMMAQAFGSDFLDSEISLNETTILWQPPT